MNTRSKTTHTGPGHYAADPAWCEGCHQEQEGRRRIESRAEVITLCGSSKFKDAINAENARLTMEGHLVISLGLFGHADLPDYDWTTDASDLKRMLDKIHFQKIDMADRVHVVNVGGYYGESTAREIAYAQSLGKPVTFMETS